MGYNLLGALLVNNLDGVLRLLAVFPAPCQTMSRRVTTNSLPVQVANKTGGVLFDGINRLNYLLPILLLRWLPVVNGGSPLVVGRGIDTGARRSASPLLLLLLRLGGSRGPSALGTARRVHRATTNRLEVLLQNLLGTASNNQYGTASCS